MARNSAANLIDHVRVGVDGSIPIKSKATQGKIIQHRQERMPVALSLGGGNLGLDVHQLLRLSQVLGSQGADDKAVVTSAAIILPLFLVERS